MSVSLHSIRQNLAAGIFGLGLLGMVWALAGQEPPAGSPGPNQGRVQPAPAQVPAQREAVVAGFSGLAEASRKVDLGAPLDGVLGHIKVQESQAVEAQEVLAVMDDRAQAAAVEIARLRFKDDSEMRHQELLLAESDIQLEQTQELHKNNAAQAWEVRRSKVQRDAAEVALEAAMQRHDLAALTLRLEEIRLTQYRIHAPFAGRVVRIVSEDGASLRPGQPIMALVALDPLEARFFLPASLYNRTQVGQEYKLEAGEPVNRTLTGRIKSIEPIIDTASQSFRCVMEIANPEQKLPGGFSVRLVWPGVGQKP